MSNKPACQNTKNILHLAENKKKKHRHIQASQGVKKSGELFWTRSNYALELSVNIHNTGSYRKTFYSKISQDAEREMFQRKAKYHWQRVVNLNRL